MGFIKIPGIDISPADALVGDVLAPKTFFSVAAPIKTGVMPEVTLVAGSNAYPAGHHVGDVLGLKHIEPNLQAAFIVAGVNIFGTVGIYNAFDRWFPITIGLDAPVVSVKPIDESHNEDAPLTSSHVEVYDDQPASGVKRLTPTIVSVDAAAVVTPDHNQNTNAPLLAEGGCQMLIDGAVADDGGAETDETAEARDATANDMTLLPAAPAVGDAYMLGSTHKAHRFWINIGTAGSGNWTLVMKYWDGGAWVACVDEKDTTAQFQALGMKYWQHTPQGDWATKVIQGMDLYWVRIEVTNFVNLVTQPKGTQSWWEIIA
jgi:hypothetical protein